MTTTSTSFSGLHNTAERIEIPIIQRDYVQGRIDESTNRIRGEFLGALLGALIPNAAAQPIDFVYGEIKGGVLIPLDGQQRLTTLFLLHWYLAARLGIRTDSVDWTSLPTFTYRTRASSNSFCKQLATCRPPFANPLADEKDPNNGLGDWLKDQSWFPKSWERDPTITSMLVTIDDLHKRLLAWDEAQLQIAWNRLTDIQSPAIHFDFLAITQIGPADRQYIRMNARGKPLTEFERFKARFEEMLDHTSQTDREIFARQVDGPWTDLLWPLRCSGKKSVLDTVIDDEFLRLFRYLSALVVWKFQPPDCKAEPGDLELHTWAEALYGLGDGNGERRAFLFKALNALHSTFAGKDRQAIEADFAQWFTNDKHISGKVAIFESPNFLAECVAGFGDTSIQNSRFSLVQTLLFYALLHRWIKNCLIDAQRLRVLRNLLLAPNADLRQEWLADYFLPGVEYLIDHSLPATGAPMPVELDKAFNERQLNEELEKLALKSGRADLAEGLERLEDHPLLKGCLFPFDLQANPADIQRRADIFFELFPPGELLRYGKLLTGALLTKGDYCRPFSDRFQFGSSTKHDCWRDVLTGPRENPSPIRELMGALIDDVAAREGDIGSRLENIVDDWLKKQKRFDWRYYFVQYECMRSGVGGRYYSASGGMGFDLCMLWNERLSSFCDPFIFGIVDESNINKDDVTYWFGSSDQYLQQARWLQTKGEAKILRADPAGWVVNPPADPVQQAAFAKVRREHCMKKLKGEWFLEVPQVQIKGGHYFDTANRIELGSSLLADLLPLYL